MKKWFFIGLLGPLSMSAQMSATQDIFKQGATGDTLESPLTHLAFTMDYKQQTGTVNGEKVAILSAECLPFLHQTIVRYRAEKQVFRLVFFFNSKGRYDHFSLNLIP